VSGITKPFPRLRDFRPSPCDAPAYVEGREDWLVTDAITRNCTVSKRAAFLRRAEKRGAEVHKLRHWTVGWIELALGPPALDTTPESR
jgi:hypothetical protein